MTKRLLLALLSLWLVVPAMAYDFSVEMPEGYSLYFDVLNEEEYTVALTYPGTSGGYWKGHVSPSGILNIPAEVDHDGTFYTVVAIGDRAFSGCSSISALNMPPTITEIGAYAFYQCSGIRGVLTIGETITSIGKSAFSGCSGITEVRFNAVNCELMGGSRGGMVFSNCRSLTKLTFGSAVKIIPDYAFVGLESLKFEWQLPQGLEYVGEYAFAYCFNINGKLTVPRSVKKIAPYAFARCHAMTQVYLPAQLERIDHRAFYQCVNLKMVTSHSIVPPVAGSEIFEGLPASAVLNVPCPSVDRYKKADGWKRIRTVKALEPCTLKVMARVSKPEGGTVYGTGVYNVGDTVLLAAVCNTGYGFMGWNDGVTDNPRSIIVDDTLTYVADIRPYEIIHEVEYVHDTVYMDGVEVVYEYYEINDVADLINTQEEVVYNKDQRSLEIHYDKAELMSVSLYNDAGQCVLTGIPKHGVIKMKRFPSGAYIVRVSTIDKEHTLRFFHNKNK